MAEEKKKAINRLKSMYPLRDNIDKMYQRVVEASKAGKPTALKENSSCGWEIWPEARAFWK